MKKYKNLHQSSSVDAYEYGNDWIRVQFTSGIIRTYTYKNVGWLNVEAMKQCADAGEGLSSYIYGPFGFRALLSKLSCRFLWLRHLDLFSFINRHLTYILTPYNNYIKYSSENPKNINSVQKNKKTASEDNSVLKNRSIHITFEADNAIRLHSGNVKHSANEEVPALKNSCCVAHLLGALKRLPETISPTS